METPNITTLAYVKREGQRIGTLLPTITETYPLGRKNERGVGLM